MDIRGITFKRDYGLITVKAFALGKKTIKQLIMVVDTGSYLSLITPDIAGMISYSESDSIGKFSVSSPIGKESGYRIRVRKFEVGKISEENLEVGVIPIHESYGIDGLIGLNFLENYHIKINFKKNEIYLENP